MVPCTSCVLGPVLSRSPLAAIGLGLTRVFAQHLRVHPQITSNISDRTLVLNRQANPN
jgi:hypothetical protein